MEQKLRSENHNITYYHALNNLNIEKLKELSTNTSDSEYKNSLCPRVGIRILTYNIFLRPPPIKNNADDFKNERLEDFCKVINEYDIICLQEMFGTYNSRKQLIIQRANKCGFFFYTDTLTPNMFSKHMIDAGLLILSRFPIVESCFYPFTYGVLSDNLAEKGILYAKIKINHQYFNIMTTHLQASYFDSTEFHFNVSYSTRMEQLQEMRKIVKEILNIYYNDENELIMLVGDLNVDANRYKFKKPTAVKNYDHLFVEYDNMMLYLCDEEVQFYDIFKKYNLPHQITYGEDENEEILTWVTDRGSKQCLDYMFEIRYKSNHSNTDLLLEKSTIKIEKFFLKRYQCFQNVLKKRAYKQLSDHYGISVMLNTQDEQKAEEYSKIIKEFYSDYESDYNFNSILGGLTEDPLLLESETDIGNFDNKNELVEDDDVKNLI